MSRNRNFHVGVLAASIALAMGTTPALASTAPSALQLPGKGATSGTGTVTPSAIVSGAQTIGVNGTMVIDWGAGSDINADGVGGFNIGSGASLEFDDTSGGAGSAVLNIDSSGNVSQIFGSLTGNGTNIFVANKNGVIVGSTARISGTGQVGLIANTLVSPGSFTGSASSLDYDSSGGDVAVQKGANVHGANVLIAGGGTVNVDVSALAGNTTLTAGMPQGDPAMNNSHANLVLSGQQTDGLPLSLTSAGGVSNSGVLNIVASDANTAGTFTNTGTLTLTGAGYVAAALTNSGTVNASGASFGALTNNGTYNAGGMLTVSHGALINSGLITGALGLSVTLGDLTNKGQISDVGAINVTSGTLNNAGTISTGGKTLYVTNGDLVNSGTISGASSIYVADGSFTNTSTGALNGTGLLVTYADANARPGADYSITNAGLIYQTAASAFGNSLRIEANDKAGDDGTTGSFTNTGTLQVSSGTFATAGYSELGAYAQSNVTLAGTVKVDGQLDSLANPVSRLSLGSIAGTTTLSTPLTVGGNAFLQAGSQVRMMANLAVDSTNEKDYPGGQTYLYVQAGDKQTNDYSIRVGGGVTVSADYVEFMGNNQSVRPNVILQGKVAGNQIHFGDVVNGTSDYAVSDVFSGPNGSIVARGGSPVLEFEFTGRIKNAPYLNDANFRYNFLPISVTGGTPLTLLLNPAAYTTNGTSNGLSAVNLLANGKVTLGYTGLGAFVGANGTAVTGALNIPNTHLVLQATGSIATAGTFYWPGYVYLGTIGANADGSAAPGTLGAGTIALGGDLNNVLPGSIDSGAGIHFITQSPLLMNGHTVTTNANSQVNFGTDALTHAYASGGEGIGLFFAGKQGDGDVVNYGRLDPSLFVTQAPVSTR